MRTAMHWAGFTALILLTLPNAAQDSRQRPWASNVVVPQARSFRTDLHAAGVEVTGVFARIELVDGIATTTLDVSLANPGGRAAEAELLLPVPDGAVVSGFDFEGTAPHSTARLLLEDEATATYEAIVRKLKDPAILEFAGAALVRSSVFPVPAGGTQKVRVRYEHVMPGEGNRWDYILPRSESLAVQVPWRVEIEVRSNRSIVDVYSPSHDLELRSRTPGRVSLRARPGTRMEAGNLRISTLLSDDPIATTLFASADETGPGGWFLLLSGLSQAPDDMLLPRREVTIVLDRSGSMAGEKFDQARAAALQVMEGLNEGEAVQIIDYSSEVTRYARTSVVKSSQEISALRSYLAGLTTGGGTNLDAALQAALTTAPREGFLPIVLFLTDGLPTEGEVREAQIRERARCGNHHARRIFTFGVGNSVNAPLLDALATSSRGRATYVRPAEDVELAVAGVFKNLTGPIVTDVGLAVKSADGALSTRLVRDLYPQVLPDLYEDDRLVLLGRYTSAEEVVFEMTGKRAGVDTTWSLRFDFEKALPRNDFVRRLWAMRRVAALEDELRQAGADPSALASLREHARFGEIVQELLELSTCHGVLTDSTAFLALEGTSLDDEAELIAALEENAGKNSGYRTGLRGIAAQQNVDINRAQGWANMSNALYDAEGALVTATSVQTMAGRTFFRRGERWVDGALALEKGATALTPDRVVEFGSAAHVALVRRMQSHDRAGQLALSGEILLRDGTETVLIRSPAGDAAALK